MIIRKITGIFEMARHERYLFLPWGRDAIRWATRRGEETRGGVENVR